MRALKDNPGRLIGRIAIYLLLVIGFGVVASVIYGSYWYSLRKSANGYLRSGISYAASQDYDHAVADFSEAIRIDSQFALAFYDRGLAYSFKHDPVRALADYNEAIRLDPTYADALFNRGITHGIMQDLDAAIADFSAVIRLNPRHVGAFVERGNVYGAKQDFDRASADLREAARLRPDLASDLALYNRGLMKLKNGDLAGGKADMIAARRKAINLDAAIYK